MNVIVVGGGVIGVTTAYYLARAGVRVVVAERAAEIAPETSRSNGSLITPGHSFAWASPAAPGLLARSLLGQPTSIRVRLPPDRQLLGWGVRFLGQCTSAKAQRNSLTKLRLARYSQLALEQLLERERIDCSYRQDGVLYLYRSEEEFRAGTATMALMRTHGQHMDELTPAEISALEPALASGGHQYAGALLGTTDGTGDSLAFCRELLRRCEDLGVEVRLRTSVTRVTVATGRVTGVATDRGAIAADVVVIAAGAYSPHLRIPNARSIPVYPARGFAIDVPIKDPTGAPRLGGLDERRRVAWARSGDTVRMAAIAEFAGFDREITDAARRALLDTGQELFGDALDWGRAELRVGFRPMTPDGPPIIGPSRVRGAFYNTGHGHMGWTMACGSACILRDLILRRRPEIDVTGLLPRSNRW